MIDAVLFPLLSAQSAITELVGAAIYPMLLPQDPPLPAVTYRIVGMRESTTFLTSGANRYRVQFDCWASTYGAASALRAALVAALNGFTGTVNGVDIQNARVLQPIDGFDHELLQYRLAVEFYIFCNS